MAIALLLARLLLALIFAAAGTAKVADLAATRKAVAGFGVPQKLAAPLGSALPFVELLIALALLSVGSAWLGAIAALALLAIFAAAIGANLARGQKPDCNCFGQLHSRPVSWSVFTRNLVLAAVAALVVVVGARGNSGLGLGDVGARASGMLDVKPIELAGLSLGLAAVGLLTAVVVYLRRMLKQQATVLERIDAMKRVIDEDYAEPAPLERKEAALVEGLPVGALAPSFSLPAIDGDKVTLDDLLAGGKPVLLLFVSPSCTPCKTLLPLVRVWERDYRDQLTIAVLSKGTPVENEDRAAKYEISRLLLQGEYDVAADFQAKWTPAAVVISRAGRIASQMTYGDEAIRGLVNHTVTTGGGVSADGIAAGGSNGSIPRITLGTSLFKVGEPAPRFSLTDLHGRIVGMEDLQGKDTLLLFWDPGCPFCQALSEDIRRWEESPPKRAPELAIIASGNVENVGTKARDFESLVLLDPDFEIGPLFGSNNTPSAVLIDTEGRIASDLAIGGQDVLMLAGVRKVELPIAPRIDSSPSTASIM